MALGRGDYAREERRDDDAKAKRDSPAKHYSPARKRSISGSGDDVA